MRDSVSFLAEGIKRAERTSAAPFSFFFDGFGAAYQSNEAVRLLGGIQFVDKLRRLAGGHIESKDRKAFAVFIGGGFGE
ncbi:MAG: hypothetical protein II808_02750, partial [Clostridia bacterium]|nr:hypothetical protein [Clostridia bacterium]